MKKTISLFLALVLCLSLCACSCNCGCPYCHGGSENTVPETTVPDTAMGQEQLLREWIIRTKWIRSSDDCTFTFFDDGTGVLKGTGTDHAGKPYPVSTSVEWDLKGDVLVYKLTNGYSDMYNYSEKMEIFVNEQGDKLTPEGK